MEMLLKKVIWSQLGASIDTLENAILRCPASFWNTEKQFWYLAYHTLFFLDYYLTLDPKNFSPPAPFTLSEFEADQMPDRTYSKAELLEYLAYCRQKCRHLLSSLTSELAQSDWINESGSMKYHVLEILCYNMRHVQHHAAQLNQLLRQEIDDAPQWVFRAKDAL